MTQGTPVDIEILKSLIGEKEILLAMQAQQIRTLQMKLNAMEGPQAELVVDNNKERNKNEKT